jgi:hypothetical protein
VPSVFAALENRAFKELERVFAEPFEFRPYAAGPGGGMRAPDSSRAVRQVVGIHGLRSFKSTEFGTEARGSIPARLDRVHLNFDAAQFAAGAPPRALDRFKRLDTREVFEVADVERDAEGRYKLGVKTLGFEQT